MFGRYFDDFFIGDVYKHWPGKTITESDNNLFCLITMNHHPVHLDHKFAEHQQHRKVLVVGTLVFSLVVGQSVSDVSGKAVANLNYENINHLFPVFIGDTIYSKSTVLTKRVSSSNVKRGIVKVETEAWNQNEETVLVFQRSILVPSLS
jgi:acyl dehydratase